MKTFRTEFEIFFEDISPAGMVHLEKIAEWVSMTREKYFKLTCPEHPRFIDGPVMMVTVSLSISILQRAKWADKVTAIFTVANIKRISFEIHIDFQNTRINKVFARAIQRVAFMDAQTKDFSNIPDYLRRAIVNYEFSMPRQKMSSFPRQPVPTEVSGNVGVRMTRRERVGTRRIETEIVIVGSGTAGATLAKELVKRGKQVVLLEKGKREIKLGRMRDVLRFYEGHSFQKSKEGIILYGTSMLGGTSVVASGNAVRCLQKEFLDLGIDLEQQFIEAEKELNPRPLPDKCISQGAQKILEAAQELGLEPKRIPKFIDPEKCLACGNCVLGCRNNAKWSAISYVDEAVKYGASLLTRTRAVKILIEDRKARGIEAAGQEGNIEIMADRVIIAAGGIQTPVLLQKSGIANAGKKMFCDLFMTIYGTAKNLNQAKGINAPGYVLNPGKYILFPFVDPPLQFLRYTGWRLSRHRTLGIMTKIADESIGEVDINARIRKTITAQDKEKFNAGVELAKRILIKAGTEPKSIFTLKQIRGPHPGGTAAIGEVVDNNLQVQGIKNLYVCDNSVLPKAPGLPPILTLIALSKWLAKKI